MKTLALVPALVLAAATLAAPPAVQAERRHDGGRGWHGDYRGRGYYAPRHHFRSYRSFGHRYYYRPYFYDYGYYGYPGPVYYDYGYLPPRYYLRHRRPHIGIFLRF